VRCQPRARCPEISEAFPSERAVNDALRDLVAVASKGVPAGKTRQQALVALSWAGQIALDGVPWPALVDDLARPSVTVSPKGAPGADLALRIVGSFFMGATDDAV